MRPNTWVRVVGVCAVAALVLMSSSASAKGPKLITGKLSKRGYTVIALDPGGVAKTVVAKRGRFKLRPTALRVTLHLRAPDGSYAGPIVVRAASGGKAKASAAKGKKRKKGKNQVIVGVRAGANLGKVKVKPGKGFALAKSVAARSLHAGRTATARKGAPIGAGNFGRVLVGKLKGPGADRDRDGVPTPLDIDDDGDLVLDDVDGNPAGAATAVAAQEQPELDTTAGISLGFNRQVPIVNANAPGLSDEQIQSGLRAVGKLGVTSALLSSAELDCGVLVYCTLGGTGKRLASQFDPNPQPFPACCDPDGDGFGSMGPLVPPQVQLLTGAGAEEIRGGQLLIAHATTTGGEQRDLAVTLKTIFVTVPAIASYVDELGATHAVSHPVEPFTELPVMDGPDGGSDVSVTLNFWRPQRRALPSELPPGKGRWIDIGRLHHSAHATATPQVCPLGSYAESDPNLTATTTPISGATGPIAAPVLSDSAADQAASPANTFTYTLNLTHCLASYGDTFPTGAVRNFGFVAAVPLGSVPGVPSINESAYLFRHEP